MVASWLSIVASVGMAVGPPCVYADQAISIVRKKYVMFISGEHFGIILIIYLSTRDATGFSRDVCAILYDNPAWSCCEIAAHTKGW